MRFVSFFPTPREQASETSVSMETSSHKLFPNRSEFFRNMTGVSEYCKYDLAGLQAELQQEREMKEMLKESVSDLRGTMCDLQERLRSVDGEGNEWKTRYETQVELNGQLERQIALIHERLEDLRGNPVDRLASIRAYDDMPVETLRQRLKLLTEEKCDLQSQLRDCHLRIEQEGKAFHKTNDERRAFLSEIAKLSSTVGAQRRKCFTQPQRATESQQRSSVRHSTHRVQRGKQTSRKAEADSLKGKDEEEEEEDGRRVRVNGGGGSGETAEKREEKKAQRGSRLPTLEHYLKHNS